MDDLSFLEEFGGAENATLKVVLPDGQVCYISDSVCPFKFLDHCPLLYHAFESDEHGRLQASIEATSTSSVISLLRFCYTGSYMPVGLSAELFSLLQHAEVYKLASNFDVPELQLLAHGNFSCQIECACSLPMPPQELANTIRFVYKCFANHGSQQEHNLIDTLLNYCVSTYHYHKLGQNSEFLDTVAEISAFCQDLCRTNIARDFADDCASDIIKLYSNPTPGPDFGHLALSSENIPSGMFHSAYNDQRTTASIPSSTTLTRHWGAMTLKPNMDDPPSLPSYDSCSTPTLALRPKGSRLVAYPDSDSETICKSCSTSVTPFWRRDETGAALCNVCWIFRPRSDRSRHTSQQRHSRDRKATIEHRGLPSIPTPATTSDAEDLYWNTSPKARVPDTTSSKQTQLASVEDSSDEYEGFALIHHASPPGTATPKEYMSSPELIPSASPGKASEDSSSDDDWTMI